MVDEVRDRAEADRGGEAEERRQREPLIHGRVADVRAADEHAFLDRIDRARGGVEIARRRGVEVTPAVAADALEQPLHLRLVADFFFKIDADHVDADIGGVRFADDLRRIASVVVLPVGEEHDHLIAPGFVRLRRTFARRAVRSDEQIVRQREAVANRRHPFPAQQLVVDEVDVADHVVVVEGERADHVRVVREHDERDAARDEDLDRVLGRREAVLAGRARRRRVGARERQVLKRSRRLRPSHFFEHARREIQRDDDVETARRHHRLRVRQHRVHQRDADQPERGDEDSGRKAAHDRCAIRGRRQPAHGRRCNEASPHTPACDRDRDDRRRHPRAKFRL